jgi:hypothetical protein
MVQALHHFASRKPGAFSGLDCESYFSIVRPAFFWRATCFPKPRVICEQLCIIRRRDFWDQRATALLVIELRLKQLKELIPEEFKITAVHRATLAVR